MMKEKKINVFLINKSSVKVKRGDITFRVERKKMLERSEITRLET